MAKGRLLLAGLAATLAFGGSLGVVAGVVESAPVGAANPLACTVGIGVGIVPVIYEGTGWTGTPTTSTLATNQSFARVGDHIVYEVTVFSTSGKCAFHTGKLAVTFPNGTSQKLSTSVTLAPGTTTSFTATPYQVSNADVGTHTATPGDLHAHATVSGEDKKTTGATEKAASSATFTLAVIHPETSLVKSATPSSGKIPLTVTFTFTESNTSTEPTGSTPSLLAADNIKTVHVTDTATGCTPVFKSASTGTPAPTVLKVGTHWTFTCTKSYVTAGVTFTDHATATGKAGDTRQAGTPASTGAPMTETGSANVTPTKATPTIATTQEPATATVGLTSLNDEVTVKGIVNPVTSGAGHGTLTVTLYKPGACTATNVAFTTMVTSPTYAATATTPAKDMITYTTTTGPKATVTGTWHWAASYSGDKNNTPATSACATEPVTVGKANTKVVTSTSGNVTIGTAGTVKDMVTVSPTPANAVAGTPKGHVDIYLCGPTGSNPSLCTPANEVFEQLTVALTSSATPAKATSQTFTPNATGTWCFGVTYVPSTTNYNTSTDNETGTATATECFTVTKANSKVVTSTSGNVTIGTAGTVKDMVTVSPTPANAVAGTPKGHVDIYLCGPTGSNPSLCTPANEVFEQLTVALTSSATPATATSQTFTPNATGTWCFGVTYVPSTTNYNTSTDNETGTATATECFTVTKANSKVVTSTSGNVTIGTAGTVKDMVTVSPTPANAVAGTPKGHVDIYLCGPTGSNPSLCTPATEVFEQLTVALTSSSTPATATSQTFTPNATGTWCFGVTYVPSTTNYNTSTDNETGTATATECFTVTKANSKVVTSTSGNVTIGTAGTVKDMVTVSPTPANAVAGTPKGHVDIYLCGPTGSNPSLCTPANEVFEQLTVALTSSSTPAKATSQTFTPNATGTWCFGVTYVPSTTNYNTSTDNETGTATATECFTVTKANSKVVTSTSGNVTIGTAGTVKDMVTVSPTPANAVAGTPKGHVDIYLCGPTGSNPSLCTPANEVFEQLTVALTSSATPATATSQTFTPNATGTWCFGVTYVPSTTNYNTSTDNETGTATATECFTVTKATIKVHKSDTPGTKVAVNPGGTITYTLTAHNSGTAAGTDKIHDTVPSNANLVAGSAACVTPLSAGASCSVTSSTTPLGWTVTVPAGGTVSVTFKVTVKTTDTTTVFNHGTFTGPGCTTSPSCTTNTVTNPVPNITVTKSDTPGTKVAVNPGGTITYTLTAHNSGTAAGTDAIHDTVPTNANLVAGSAACVTPLAAGASCSVTSSTTPLGWTVTVPGGGTVSVTFKVTVKPTDTTTVFNHGTYTGPGCTTSPSCTTNTVTNPVPSIKVTKADTPASGTTVTRGATLTYTLTAHNSGTAAGTDKIHDVVPSNANLVAASAACVTPLAAGASCSVTSSTTPLGWTVTVPAGGTVSVRFKVTVKTTDTTTVFNHGTYTGPGCLTSPFCTTNTVTNPVRVPVTTQTLTPGYWKNHLTCTTKKHPTQPCTKEFLPIFLGPYEVTNITKASGVLDDSGCGTTGINCLAFQLLAADLNVGNGTNGCIGTVIAAANALLTKVHYHGPGTYKSDTKAETAEAKTLDAKLSSYNSDNSGTCTVLHI